MNRIDRISAILIHLQSRKVVKAQDLASRFEISLRTVYRDIRCLEEAGIPIIGEAGIGYSLVEGYRLPPVMFSREEATAFITAEKLVEKLTDAANSAEYRSAMYKVRAVLGTADKEYISSIDSHIEVLKSKRPPHLNSEINPLQMILQAIAVRRVLDLNYFTYSRSEYVQRSIEPAGVIFFEGYWHLIAYCRLRQDYRDFRFDRIKDLVFSDKTFSTEHPRLQEYMHQRYPDKDLTEIALRIDSHASKYIGEQKYYQGFISEELKEGTIEMKFLSASIEAFARFYLGFADYARILYPEKLIIRVKEIYSGISENL